MASSENPGPGPTIGGTWTSGGDYQPASTPLTPNVWTHVAATFDGATMRVFVNGVQVASKAKASAYAPTTGTLQIGGDSYPGEFFAARPAEGGGPNAAPLAPHNPPHQDTPTPAPPPA